MPLPSVVPEEEVLRLGFGVGKGKLRRLGHVADRRMVGALELDAHGAQGFEGLLPGQHAQIHHSGVSSPSVTTRGAS